jgi:hypothetical protein
MSGDIFVDRTGRRRRALTWLGLTAAVVLVGALGLLGAGLITGGPLPLRGWTDFGGSSPAPDAAVIGPAPTPAPEHAPATPPPARPARSTGPPVATGSPGSGATPTTTLSARPGKGAGRGNRPTVKPSHGNSKAG